MNFPTIQDLSGAFSQWVKQADVEFFAKGIQMLSERWVELSVSILRMNAL